MRRVFVLLALAAALTPLIWTLLAALGVQPNNRLSPPEWSFPPRLDNFFDIRAQQTYFWDELKASALLSLAAALLATIIAFLAGYSLARLRSRWREMLAHSLLILAVLPAIAYVIPLREMMRALLLLDTFAGVVLAETAMLAPLAAYILYGYLRQLPTELEEAAFLDGASLYRLLLGVVLPEISSGVMATFVVVFVLSWNQFVLPLMLTNTHLHVIPVMLRDFFSLEREFEWGIGAAVIVISVLPAAALVAFAHRLLERFNLDAA